MPRCAGRGGRRGRVAQQPRDVIARQRVAADAVEVGGRFTRRQHLDRADAIAPERGEQIERRRAARPVALRHSAPDGFAVGQQVVEKRRHDGTAIRLIAWRERQRQRQRTALFVGDPVVEVDKTLAAAGLSQ